MAIKVFGRCSRVEFDGITIEIPISLRVTGQSTEVGHTFTGLAANIANAAAVLPYLKGQIASYVQSFFGVSVVESEISLTGVPL